MESQLRPGDGFVIWLTGLSGSGKSTLSSELCRIIKKFQLCYVLDGDVLRKGLNSDLGFSAKDREENIRRLTEVCKLFAGTGFVVITAFISPFKNGRDFARKCCENNDIKFVEVFVNSPLDVCENRDVKGLYKLARAGKIKEFTGISSVYEKPENPDVELKTSELTVDECIKQLINHLVKKNLIRSFQVEISAPKELFFSQQDIAVDDKIVRIDIDKIDMQWVQVLAEGWAHPLSGFMKEDNYLQTLHFNTNKYDDDFVNQSIPIVLDIPDEKKTTLLESKRKSVCLVYDGKDVALLENCEIFPHRKEERCARQFGTISVQHPAVKLIYGKSEWLIGGDLKVFEKITWNDGLDDYRLSPKQIREKFLQVGADAVFAFQLRNPIHNGHALLMKETRKKLLERGFKKPVLLLHPLGGWTKDDDVPLSVRIEQHKAVINDGILDSDWTILSIFPSPMMYAGPTEVQWHCRCRLVAGANFYIVGRDPAGIPHPEDKLKDLFDPTHGSRVLTMAPGLNKLEIVPFKVAAYNKVNKCMEIFNSDKKEEYDFISGTRMRKMAREGKNPPDGFMSQNAWKIMKDFYS